MLKWIVGLFLAKASVATIVADLDKVRARPAARVDAKAEERDQHGATAMEFQALADAAHFEMRRAEEVAGNLGKLLGA